MSFLAPLGLFALASLPAVVALHLFRKRLPERRIAGLFLWPSDATAAQTGRRRAHLLRSPSFWCELALALLVSLLLGKIAFGITTPATHFVVVLDDSASMGASAGTRNVCEDARALVRDRLTALPNTAVVTLVTTGPRPEIAAGPRVPRELALAALARWNPTRPNHDPLPTLHFAAQMLANSGDDALFVTDAVPIDTAALPKSIAIRALGTQLGNHAIVAARRQRAETGTGEDVFVDLMTFTAAATEITVTVVAEDSAATELARSSLRAEPGAVQHVALGIPTTRAGIRVKLPPDALAIDNEVLLLPEPQHVVHVANLLSQEATRALRIEALLRAVPGVERAATAAAADLVLAPVRGTLRPFRSELVIAPALPGAGTASAPSSEPAPEDWLGPYLLERRHPLLRGVSLDGVVWSSGPADFPGQVLASAGDRVLVSEELGEDSGRTLVNLDPSRSNLAAAPDWPILFANVVERARARLAGPLAANVHVGERLVWRSDLASAEARDLHFVGPDAHAWPVRGATTFTHEARQPGIWRLLAGTRELARWSAAFTDPVESDLRTRGTGEVAAPPFEGTTAAGLADTAGGLESRILACLVLLFLGLDWWFLAREGGAG